jgi:hypothetical protein
LAAPDKPKPTDQFDPEMLTGLDESVDASKWSVTGAAVFVKPPFPSLMSVGSMACQLPEASLKLTASE